MWLRVLCRSHYEGEATSGLHVPRRTVKIDHRWVDLLASQERQGEAACVESNGRRGGRPLPRSLGLKGSEEICP